MDALRPHKLQESISFAVVGMWQAIRSERNIKIELSIAIMAILAGLFFGITKGEWLAIIIMIFAVISAEIFNSAVEAVCNCERDALSLNYKATKAARDISAGAVLFLAMGSVVLGVVIFLPYLLQALSSNLLI